MNMMGNHTIQTFQIECTEEGSLRRVGGQGDILAGSIGTFLAWATKKKDNKEEQSLEEKCESHFTQHLRLLLLVTHSLPVSIDSLSGTILAGYSGCYIAKATSKLAFAQYNRSTITSNMIEHVGKAFTSIL